jgi:hypothetical protein
MVVVTGGEPSEPTASAISALGRNEFVRIARGRGDLTARHRIMIRRPACTRVPSFVYLGMVGRMA